MTQRNKLIVGAVVVLGAYYLYDRNKKMQEVARLKAQSIAQAEAEALAEANAMLGANIRANAFNPKYMAEIEAGTGKNVR